MNFQVESLSMKHKGNRWVLSFSSLEASSYRLENGLFPSVSSVRENSAIGRWTRIICLGLNRKEKMGRVIAVMAGTGEFFLVQNRGWKIRWTTSICLTLRRRWAIAENLHDGLATLIDAALSRVQHHPESRPSQAADPTSFFMLFFSLIYTCYRKVPAVIRISDSAQTSRYFWM